MPEITATVVAKSPHGIKIEQDGPWWNWSKAEYRGEPFNTAVKAGDRVHITYSEKEYQDKETGQPYTTAFISTIEVVTTGRDPVGIAPDPSDMSGSDFSPDIPSDAPEPSPEAYGQDLWAKDELRARTDCIACATGIFKSCIEAGLYKEVPTAQTLVTYAAALEKWAKSE